LAEKERPQLKRNLKLIAALLSVWALFACASGKGSPLKGAPPAPQADWVYEKDAVRLVFKADRELNLYNGVHHALSVCVYQLKDPNAFNQLGSDRNGLYVLLGCETFDPSVTSFRRITVQPGQELTVTLDRAQASRYVGIAAGYYAIEREKIIRLAEIPVEVKTSGFFFRTQYAITAPLSLNVVLGPQAIQRVEAIP
jgi:type VI secretion system VasD/TssJ family lipoprotein